MMNINFEFTDTYTDSDSVNSFVLKIPEGIQSKMQLFTEFASEGRFPLYFGANWDALFDCLRDFKWIHEQRMIILHRDLPLSNNIADCRAYLEILQAAISDWTSRVGQSNINTVSTRFSNHELLVISPKAVQKKIFDFSLQPVP